MKRQLLMLALAGACSACMPTDPVALEPLANPCPGCVEQRISVARDTCEAQAAPQEREYLAAVQDLIARAGGSAAAYQAAAGASLDKFREEIIVSYRTVVSRCKTHIECLEVNNYDEARCYMAAADRKDAEREFRQIAYDLRDLEREVRLAEIEASKSAARSKRPAPNVTVNTNVSQTNEQEQETTVGDEIADQDVLVVCGADELLSKKCRSQCRDKRCD